MPKKPAASTKLNLETARISWSELQRFFAQGSMIVVDDKLDLVQVAAYVAEDNSEKVKEFMTNGSIRKANTEDARKWNDSDSELWAVVTAPWVLVQETSN